MDWISRVTYFSLYFSSEQKRRLKAEEKAKEKAKKAENVPVQEEGAKKKGAAKEEEISPNEYFKLRSLAVQQLKTTSCPPYPHKFHVDTSLQDFIEKFTYLVKEQSLQDQTLSVAGLLLYLSNMHKLCFIKFSYKTIQVASMQFENLGLNLYSTSSRVREYIFKSWPTCKPTSPQTFSMTTWLKSREETLLAWRVIRLELKLASSRSFHVKWSFSLHVFMLCLISMAWKIR